MDKCAYFKLFGYFRKFMYKLLKFIKLSVIILCGRAGYNQFFNIITLRMEKQ